MLPSKPDTVEYEKKLSARVADGDKEAFEELFRTYYGGLYVLATRYLKDESLAEDALQEIFLKVWLNRTMLDPGLPVRNYLYTVAKNHILNTLRNNSSASRKIIDYMRSNQEDSAGEAEFTPPELFSAIYKVIDSLPKKRRLVTKLKLYKGLDNLKIAQKLNLSINTVKFHYSQALKQIRELL
jgi:RNA polymerase sigma-70 factor (family 1)